MRHHMLCYWGDYFFFKCQSAVTTAISVLLSGLTRYLNMVFGVDMPPNQQGHCSIIAFGLFFGSMSSTFFITNMTFERFYSILVPHKAASFNTVKRAKITIACILVFSLLFNFPHFFISSNTGRVCNSFGKAIRSKYGQVYYWFFFCLNFTVPFASLLTMNVFIIYTLKSRSMTFLGGSSNQGHSQGQTMRNSERQITITLLLVTFVFLILSIPGLVMVFYTNYIDVRRSKYTFAGYYLFYNVAQKAVYTNHGINFFLYVISGKKFRVDLINLFSCSENSGVDMTMGSDINPKIKAFSVKKQEHLSGQVRRKTEE